MLPRRSQALYLVQRIRDEAHRFAITYHRDVRGKRALRSELDEIAGIGPGTQAGAAEAVRVGAPDPGGVRRRGGMRRPESAATLAERVKAHLAREGMLA